MPTTEFSKAVIAGLRLRGYSDERIAEAAGVSTVAVALLADGARRLRESQLASIENETQVTAGQIAALTLEPDGGPLTELMDEWAKVAPPAARRAARRRKSSPSFK